MSGRPKVAAISCQPSYLKAPAVENAVEQALKFLDLPADFVSPGETVVLKPNWVKEHDERKPGPGQWEHIVTHPAVIEAVAAWVAERLRGKGRIVICDAPQTDSSFETLVEYCGLQPMILRLRDRFPGVEVQLLDLRPEEWRAVDGVVISKKAQPGDPAGNTQVCLDRASEFVEFAGQGRLYGASFNMAETNEHDSGSRQD